LSCCITSLWAGNGDDEIGHSGLSRNRLITIVSAGKDIPYPAQSLAIGKSPLFIPSLAISTAWASPYQNTLPSLPSPR
jgi:hypothetical protein